MDKQAINKIVNEHNLSNLQSWDDEFDGNHICYWHYKLDREEGHEEYEAFHLVIQEENDKYTIEIDVTPYQGVGDLLNAQEYFDTTDNLEDAVIIGNQFIDKLEDNYSLKSRN